MIDGEDKNKNKIQALLAEWRLCQDNANATVRWSWQIGTLLIGLSLAAIWVQFQIEISNRLPYSMVLAFFSIIAILIWDFTIALRSRFYIDLSYKRARALEYEIGKLCYSDTRGKFKNPYDEHTPYNEHTTLILHTFIDSEDHKERTGKGIRSIWGMISFNVLVIFTWIAIIIVNWYFLAIDP